MACSTKSRYEYLFSPTVIFGLVIGILIPTLQHIPIVGEWTLVQLVAAPREIYHTVALMSGTMTGIVLTNLTILTSWWTNPRMRPITDSSRHSRNIWMQLKITIWLLLTNAVVCLAARQIDTADHPVPWMKWVF